MQGLRISLPWCVNTFVASWPNWLSRNRIVHTRATLQHPNKCVPEICTNHAATLLLAPGGKCSSRNKLNDFHVSSSTCLRIHDYHAWNRLAGFEMGQPASKMGQLALKWASGCQSVRNVCVYVCILYIMRMRYICGPRVIFLAKLPRTAVTLYIYRTSMVYMVYFRIIFLFIV